MLAKMSNVRKFMPVLLAHLEMIVEVVDIQQIVSIIHSACGMSRKMVNAEVMPKRKSDAARLRNSILVALFNRVHLFVQ